MTDDPLLFVHHAIQQMILRDISEVEVREVVEHGEVIDEYSAEQPFPARLLFGRPGGRALHVVAMDNPETGKTHIITVYEPDRDRWMNEYRMRTVIE